ncbi:type VI secretion system baseplate subunit TssF [Pseudoduganella ginsengisoli]|uniref:Type VI secretion system baseplate subunit TssF n=1 Tax=Pseudoduganella ginsengisoli TaxID=1462440 RepID=A0A6L6PVH8_9BURK|nr:type VI secretion system baseplate subunit TssF [Pseudoduganella ginsengisoli]MTW01490.1 type VI secretion system baseplate subunit TssF [Pseudoduganella ginsengisoli]
MEQLLPYYERELGFLRRYSREFAERYPKIAGRLQVSGEVCEDPHIERMIESFALMNSRIAKRLDDDYPEFTEAMFEAMYPHYLRPFPSCSIARMDVGAAAAQLTSATHIPRGTQLTSRPVKGAACTFRTAYPVTVAPLAVTEAAFTPILAMPETVRAPSGATSSISITLSGTSEQAGPLQLGLSKLRLFIDGEPSFCAALRDALFMRTVAAYVEGDRDGRWRALPASPLAQAGFDDDDALIDFSARSHGAYRLLTEYFCFPEKFNFFDIDMALLASVLPPDSRKVTIHLALSGLRTDSNVARILAPLSVNHVLTGCTPVVNQFRQRGEPIRVTHTAASYPVLADARRAFAYEVQAIESVRLVRQTPQGESVTAFRPFYSLRHGQTPEKHGHYWVSRRNDAAAPGYETEISIVDIDFDPAAVETDTLSLELSCTNRDLPLLLSYGARGGDLFMEGGSAVRAISLLRKPTPSYRFERGGGAQWRLISHLSLNHLSLDEDGLDAFREMLALYDLPRSPSTQRLIGGVRGITHKAANAWLPGNPFACLVRGVEVRLAIDEEAFVGSGIHAFAHLVERFLGLYVHANSFAQLVVVSHQTGEDLLRCLPRSGDLSLL